MGQIDTADYLRDMGVEPIHDPLHAGEPEDQSRIKEVRDSVNWAKRLTYNADGISQKAIDAIVNSRSIGIVRKNAYAGETDGALATPQFTANTHEAQQRVKKSIERRLNVVINNASKWKLITPDRAKELIDEVPIRNLGARFQPKREVIPHEQTKK